MNSLPARFYPWRALTLLACSFAVFAVCWLAVPAAVQADPVSVIDRAVMATLVADTTGVEPGKPFTVGVRFDIETGWDIYWQFVGDLGMATKVTWELPPGFTAGPLQWPMPEAHLATGDLLNYVYFNHVLLFAEITPPAKLPSGPLTIKAKASWQMCDPSRCEQGKAALELPLSAETGQPANADLFQEWRAQLPKREAPPFTVKWDRSKDNEFSLRVEGLAKDSKAEFFPLPPGGQTPGHPTTSEIADDGARTLTFPVDGGKPNLPWRGIIAAEKEGAPRVGWLISAEPEAATPTATSAAATNTTPGAGSTSGPGSYPNGLSAPPSGGGSLFWKLCAAFLGGLIMNIMPCVLPVITLKIYGFIHQAGQAPGRVFRLGLAFNAGVFAFFLMLAAIMANLRGAFNWGYQLQNPYLLAGMIALVFLLGLSLLGVFEISLTGGAASTIGELSSKEGYGGAFLHGLFTTLLGTSCTAPFLGTSLSYAVTQPVPVIFLIFSAIAAGMCLPYFLLTVQPAWMRFLPKPGLWMERVKQVMGFAMLAVTAWLFGVLAAHGKGAVAAMSWFLVVLAFAAWLYGLRGSWVTRLASLLIPIGGYWFFVHGNLTGGREQTASGVEQRIQAAHAAGLPVFIDFTADWCPNCKAFEKAVLNTESIQTKFREKNVVFVTADWTITDDPEVTRLLKGYGAVGVPLYVLYRPGEAQPMIKEVLTKSGLIEELDKIKSPPAKTTANSGTPSTATAGN